MLWEWEEKESSFIQLVDGLVDALSPKQCFAEYPLNELEESDKMFLSDVVHKLYLQRTGIRIKQRSLQKSVAEVSQAIAAVRSCYDPDNGDTATMGNLSTHPVQQLLAACEKMSRQISSLPRFIQVI